METAKFKVEPGKSETLEEIVMSPLKVLTNMAKRPEVDIEFRNLTYVVRSGYSLNTKKIILDGISGTFRTGEIAAILGPSGAGKSSLMNILAAYSSVGVTGDIYVNGRPRNKHLFHKLSCYIMQDDLVQMGLTINEAMNVAANLKLGSELNSHEKKLVIEEILETLGLAIIQNTRVEKLSGGQLKRLTIALELVNNPPIIFLDEATSGLDTFSIKHTITLLKHLARTGRTIICTIHQPSASIFSLFDQVYFVTKGKCVYQGSPSNLVPFMKKLEFYCPVTHNPADFVLETLQSNTENIKLFSKAIRNGKNNETERTGKSKKLKDLEIEDVLPKDIVKEGYLSTSFKTQFIILLQRMVLQKRRNLSSLWLLIAHHIISGLLIGAIFYNIGNNGSIPIANFKFCLSVIVFFMYTYVMTPILLFPSEFQLLRREHFNRWYGLKAYFLAMTISNLPVIILLGFEFLMVTYWMSGQIVEWRRFILFTVSSILTALSSEGFGLAIGATFTVRSGAVLGPCVISPLLALSVYGLGFGPRIETFMYTLMRFSYLRYGLAGLCISLYSERSHLECSEELYCHYSDPKILLRDLGMVDSSYVYEMVGLICFAVVHRTAAYVALHLRLEEEFSDRIRKYLLVLLRNK